MKSGVSMRIFPPGIQLIWPRRCKGTWAVFGLEVSDVQGPPRRRTEPALRTARGETGMESALHFGQRSRNRSNAVRRDVTSRSALATRRGQVIEA